MITAFYFYRKWHLQVESITDPIAYESECIDYMDSAWAYCWHHDLNPTGFLELVEQLHTELPLFNFKWDDK